MVDLGPDAARAKAAAADTARIAAAKASAAKNQDLITRFGSTGEGGSLSIGQDTYGNWHLMEQLANGQPINKYFVVSPNGTDWSIANAYEAVKSYKTAANKSIGLEALRKKLYEVGLMSKADYTTKDEGAFNNAILGAANNHTVEQVQKYTLNPGQSSYTFVPFDKWLAGKSSSLTPTASTPKVDTTLIKTTKVDTDQDINAFMNDMLGNDATDAEKLDYYTKVSAEEAKASQKSTIKGTTETITGQHLNADDYWRIASGIVGARIKNTLPQDIDKLGGKVASQMNELKDYASNMGVKWDSKTALNYVIEGLNTGGSLATGKLDTQKNTIKETSKALYKNLADSIDRGLKVSDVAGQFAQYKGNILELPDNSIDPFDPDIQKALVNEGGAGVMSIGDFQRLMYQDPRYGKTKAAHETAATYANTILKSFGFQG
jgi:hypothetical protein